MKKINCYIILLVCFILIGNVDLAFGNNGGVIIDEEGIIREEPSFEGAQVDIIHLGERVNILDEQGAWTLVEFISEEDIIVRGWVDSNTILSKNNVRKLRVGIVRANVLNVRSGPGTNFNIFNSLRRGEEVNIIGEQDEWYFILLKNGVKGWINSQFVDTNVKYLYPKGQVILNGHVREQQCEESSILTSLLVGDYVYIKGYEQGWFHIITEEIEGWVLYEDIEIVINELIPISRSANRSMPLTDIGLIGAKYIGSPYKYGSTGPNNFDCSGFVFYIFNNYYSEYLNRANVKLPRISRDMAKVGTVVAKADLIPGDLVFFNRGGKTVISHVGIYIGEGKFIHSASRNKRGVIISSLYESAYLKTYVRGIRI